MPAERVPISVSQLCELIEVDPKRFVAVESEKGRHSTRLFIVLEPVEKTLVLRDDEVTEVRPPHGN